MKRILVWSLGGLALLGLLLTTGVLLYVRLATAPPDSAALAALESDAYVEVTQGEWITFTPRSTTPTTGLILYPGGFVDPRAYAPVARRIAADGYLVVVPSMPLNLAVLGADRAGSIIASYPDVERWAVGGHSLGGAMAAQYAYRNPDTVDALILWAAYPPDSVDLSDRELVTASIYGTVDGLVSQAEIDDSMDRLPATARMVPIEGGNHAQFGSYGPQRGDLTAAISAQEQQAEVARATSTALAAIEP